MRVLVTGSAGFIGFHLAKRLLAEGDEVCGVDNFNDYYSVELKEARNAILEKEPNFSVNRVNIADKASLQAVFDDFKPEIVVNLAAQTGVRYSIKRPEAYVESNIAGFLNVLECCRNQVPHARLLYASSSSVYGGINELPFHEGMDVSSPISMYAVSKKSNELMAHCYSHMYGMQTLGFRFFSVYGPWGRPDVAGWVFAKAMLEGRTIQVFNHGDMVRDFTYVDDVVNGVVRSIRHAHELPQCEIYNVGNNHAEKLIDMIMIIAHELGVEKPKMEMLPMQQGDIYASLASIDKLRAAVGYRPTTSLSVGMSRFCAWYKEWRKGHLNA